MKSIIHNNILKVGNFKLTHFIIYSYILSLQFDIFYLLSTIMNVHNTWKYIIIPTLEYTFISFWSFFWYFMVVSGDFMQFSSSNMHKISHRAENAKIKIKIIGRYHFTLTVDESAFLPISGPKYTYYTHCF